MPSREEHLDQARRNESFCSETRSIPFREWVLTGWFYAALHYVEAFFATRHSPEARSAHKMTHGKRQRRMSGESDLLPIFPDYEELKTQSENARYECYSVSEEDLAEAEALLVRIREHVSPLIGESNAS